MNLFKNKLQVNKCINNKFINTVKLGTKNPLMTNIKTNINKIFKNNKKSILINKRYYNTVSDKSNIININNNDDKNIIDDNVCNKNNESRESDYIEKMYAYGIIACGIAGGWFLLVHGIKSALDNNDDNAILHLLYVPVFVTAGFMCGIVVGVGWPITVPVVVMGSLDCGYFNL